MGELCLEKVMIGGATYAWLDARRRGVVLMMIYSERAMQLFLIFFWGSSD